MVQSEVERLSREASGAGVSPERLTDLAGHRSAFVRAAVAGNTRTPIAVVLQLLGDDRFEPRCAAAELGTTRPEVGEAVLRSPRRELRAFFAQLAMGIADSGEAPVDPRWQVAVASGATDAWKVELDVGRHRRSRPPLPEAVQRVLATDPDWQVRESLAAHTGLPAVLDQLLTDPHPRVRMSCDQNPSITPEQVERLVVDRSSVVRRAVAGWAPLSADQTDRLARDRQASVVEGLLSRPGLPDRVLRWVAEHRDESRLVDRANQRLGDPTRHSNRDSIDEFRASDADPSSLIDWLTEHEK